MKSMKLKIIDGAYCDLLLGRRVTTMAINDNVSTTRNDAERRVHQYESRWSLMNAFMVASKAKRITVVSQEHPDELTCRVCGVGGVGIGGLWFYIDLAPVEREEVA